VGEGGETKAVTLHVVANIDEIFPRILHFVIDKMHSFLIFSYNSRD